MSVGSRRNANALSPVSSCDGWCPLVVAFKGFAKTRTIIAGRLISTIFILSGANSVPNCFYLQIGPVAVAEIAGAATVPFHFNVPVNFGNGAALPRVIASDPLTNSPSAAFLICCLFRRGKASSDTTPSLQYVRVQRSGFSKASKLIKELISHHFRQLHPPIRPLSLPYLGPWIWRLPSDLIEPSILKRFDGQIGTVGSGRRGVKAIIRGHRTHRD